MSNTEEIQNAEDRLRAMSPDRSSFHRLEELVCGQLFWRAIAKRSDRKLSAMLNDENISNESSEFVLRDLFTDRCHERGKNCGSAGVRARKQVRECGWVGGGGGGRVGEQVRVCMGELSMYGGVGF